MYFLPEFDQTTKNNHFALCLSHNLNEMVGCQLHLQIENSKPLWPNLWCQFWNCDWNKTKIDARKSRNWCQWAWGNPRDKKDTDTVHCPRPLYLYFVTLWFLVCIQSYVTLFTIVFHNSLIFMQRRIFLIWKHYWTQLFSMIDWYGGIFTSLMKPLT